MSSQPKESEPEIIASPSLLSVLISNSANLVLLLIVSVIIYKIYRSKFVKGAAETAKADLPRLRKDMGTVELRQYDGTRPDGRVLVAVNGCIFDVTKATRFYGPGGPYAAYGGTDASRGLATFSVTSSDKVYDDLSDLNSKEMESVTEWEAQFREKYPLVGRLLRPGEEPTNYSDEETEETDSSSNENRKEK